MRSARRTTPVLALALLLSLLPGGPIEPAAAAEFELETTAAYDVRPDEGIVAVEVEMTFTNTTPDPEGQFSVFPELLVAVHDGVRDADASDEDGDLAVEVASDGDVNVATIELRDGLRYEESVDVTLRYDLVDGEHASIRVRPSVVVFPAWSFGTSGAVTVDVPAGYEARVDGDALTASDGRLASGPIEDPSRWLAVVTAVRPADYVTLEATVPLAGGTADLQVRAFADDEAWGERTIDLVERALPLLEEELGLPYPRLGSLVLTESVTGDAAGFGESATTGTEILVAFDQPPFTALHQVAHVWLTPELVEARWIREGLASDAAARVAEQLGVDPPYDPAAEAAEHADVAFPLDSWTPTATGEEETFGHAASWAFVADLRERVGADALRTVLSRAAGSVGAYEPADVDATTDAADGSVPPFPLTSRSFLDHLESVAGVELADAFGEIVLTETDRALLPARATARAAFDELVAAAAPWGAPDPVRAEMRAWRFEDAAPHMVEALAWLALRDRLLDEMQGAGLSAPERLRQSYAAVGGGAEAHDELEAEAAVVDAYRDTAETVNGERSFLTRVGLLGGPDPASRLTVANGRFGDGDLRGAVEAIGEAQGILASAETGGVIRLVSAALVVVILAAGAVLLLRRRATYTAAP